MKPFINVQKMSYFLARFGKELSAKILHGKVKVKAWWPPVGKIRVEE